MIKTVQGIVHGKLIELNEEPGLPDGQRVEVTVRTVSVDPTSTLPTPTDWQPGMTKTVGGALADVWSVEDDRILAELEQDRQRSAFRGVGE